MWYDESSHHHTDGDFSMMMRYFIHLLPGQAIVKRETYINIRTAAQEFCDDNEDVSPHLPTVMMMMYAENLISSSSSTPSSHQKDDDPIPSWFIDGLPQSAGKSLSAKAILVSMGRPTNIGACRQAGAWLRQLGSPTRKAGGSVLFDITMALPPATAPMRLSLAASQPAGAKPADGAPKPKPGPVVDDDEEDLEDPFRPSLSIKTRMDAFLASFKGKTTTVKQAAMTIREPESKEAFAEIWRILQKEWLHISGETFNRKPS